MAPIYPSRAARRPATTRSDSSSTPAAPRRRVAGATGPLTNSRLRCGRRRTWPAHRGISLMGGGTFGNRTAAAEFNLWCRPRGGGMVFSYGGPLIMCGLDLTHQFQARPSASTWSARCPAGSPAVLADLFDFFSGTYTSRHHHISARPCTTRSPCWRSPTRTCSSASWHTSQIETQRPPHGGHDDDRPARPREVLDPELRLCSPASTPTPAWRVDRRSDRRILD